MKRKGAYFNLISVRWGNVSKIHAHLKKEIEHPGHSGVIPIILFGMRDVLSIIKSCIRVLVFIKSFFKKSMNYLKFRYTIIFIPRTDQSLLFWP